MSVYFFDSSALVKRYVTEKGTDWVRRATSTSGGHQVTVALITLVELITALARRRREGSIPGRTA